MSVTKNQSIRLMKNLLLLLISLLLSCCEAFAQNTGLPQKTGDYYPLAKNGKFGLMTVDGSQLLPTEYDEIRVLGNNSYFIVQKGGQYSLLNQDLSHASQVQFSAFKHDEIHDWFAIKTPKGWNCLNLTTQKWIPETFTEVSISQALPILCQHENKNWTVLVDSAKILQVGPFEELAALSEFHGLFKNGPKTGWVMFESGLQLEWAPNRELLVNSNDSYYFLEDQMPLLVSPKNGSILGPFLTVNYIGDGYNLVTTPDGLFGILNSEFQYTIPLTDTILYPFAGALKILAEDGNCGMISLQGKEIIPAVFRDLTKGPGQTIIAFDESGLTLFNYEGKRLAYLEGVQNHSILSGYIVYEKEGLKGILGRSGTVVTQPIYLSVTGIREHIFEVRQDSGPTIIRIEDDKISKYRQLVFIAEEPTYSSPNFPGLAPANPIVASNQIIQRTAGWYLDTNLRYNYMNANGRSYRVGFADSISDWGNGYSLYSHNFGGQHSYGILENSTGKKVLKYSLPQLDFELIKKYNLTSLRIPKVGSRWLKMYSSHAEIVSEKNIAHILGSDTLIFPVCRGGSAIANSLAGLDFGFLGPQLDTLIWTNGNWHLFNYATKSYSKTFYHRLSNIQDQRVMFKKGKKFGLMDLEEHVYLQNLDTIFRTLSCFGTYRAGPAAIFCGQSGQGDASAAYEALLPFSEGLAGAKQEEKWGFIDKAENWVIPPIYDKVFGFSQGTACAKLGDKAIILNAQGNMISEHPYNRYINYSEGILRTSTSEGMVYRTPEGNPLGEVAFRNGNPFVDGWASVENYKHKYLLGRDGTFAWPNGFEKIIHFLGTGYLGMQGGKSVLVLQDGTVGKFGGKGTVRWFNPTLVWAKSNRGFRLYDWEGNVLNDAFLLDTKPFHDGFAPAATKNGWGLMDEKGNWVIEPSYISIGPFNSEMIVVRTRKGSFLRTLQGDSIPLPPFLKASEIHQGSFAIQLKDSRWVMANAREVITAPFVSIETPFWVGDNLCYGSKGNWKILSATGREQFPISFQERPNYSEGKYVLQPHKMYFLYDRDGNLILSTWQERMDQDRELFRIWQEGELFYFDKNGNCVWPKKE